MLSPIRDTKKRGEWAELKFMARAAELGFTVSKPWGESARYDVAVEHDGRFLRVQVKSTEHKVGRAFICNVRPNSFQFHPYTIAEIDFLAAYIVPEDIWYIIPARIATRLAGNIWLSPRKSNHKYARYMEAWHLLRKPPRLRTRAAARKL